MVFCFCFQVENPGIWTRRDEGGRWVKLHSTVSDPKQNDGLNDGETFESI